MTRRLSVFALAAALAAPRAASAFCGFYVAGSDQKLFNEATQVVLMRQGTRTVLSMQNAYKGPAEAFAMVVPVPVVLHEGDVKTLPKEVFAKVEKMGAPRLVEYWEQDPCAPPVKYDTNTMPMPTGAAGAGPMDAGIGGLGVKVEAKFAVAEYQIVILSAKDSTGLATWLRAEKYQIPADAEPLLQPYVVAGMKFFVAKVDPNKVTFENGRAALSPLRFYYDSEELSLPIRLGLANSSGTQDLIVNILAPNQRYAVANHDNVTIPTNLDVKDEVKEHFGAFYAALFDRTVEKHPGAVITEYAWQATTCDPCPGPTLDGNDLQTFGADVIGSKYQDAGSYTLTRLHARYGKEVKDDLTFRTAPPIVGGRELLREEGRLEEGSRPDTANNFQGRYAIRHPWTGPLRCEHPRRHVWGGPPRELAQQVPQPAIKPAVDLAFAPRDAVRLASEVTRDVPEIDLVVGASKDPTPATTAVTGSAVPVTTDPPTKKTSGCGCAAGERNDVLGGALLVGASLLAKRRRRRPPRRA